MSVDLKQHLALEDYLGVLAVWCVFFAILFVISIFINFACINEEDDITALEQWGYRKNLGLRLGPHSKSQIRRQVPHHIVD
ncbi:unnamed protein product [Caenorhabditis angaria]|uniref:Uncharacterized protein n=1 Tax=Caenorhabditis angaria TaxID=860376 RepID=A0A9P1II24_9PELO|nr:unnamed protein product [Caenorhabditis angaria]